MLTVVEERRVEEKDFSQLNLKKERNKAQAVKKSLSI